MKQLFIRGIGHSHPENVVTNELLTDLEIGTNDQWIMERVGIRERRTILPIDHIFLTKNKNRSENVKFINDGTQRLVLEASEMAFKRAGINKNQIDLVIAGGCTSTSLIPSDAARYANILGINAPALDFNSACSSWTAGIHFSRSLLDYKNILLINCEVPTAHVSYADRKNCVLVGDGCGVTILSRYEGDFFVEDSLFDSNPTGCDKVVLPINNFFDQDGPAVQKFAISHMIKIYEKLNKDGSAFIGHQANSRALESVVNRCGIEKHFSNIEYYGNTFAAGAASVFSQNYDNKDIKNVVVGTVGSGLSWGGARLVRL